MIKMAENAKNHPPYFTNAAFDIVAIAASAGGLNALIKVLSTVPAEFTAAIAIVQHLAPQHPSLMAEILNRRTAITVKQAEEGDWLTPGTAYIAPPNHHLLVNREGTLSLSQSESVRFLRPSADLLFESIAPIYKNRAIALVLTGTGSDGTIGVKAIKKMGGTVIVQDVKTAEFSGMPSAAIQAGNVDFILPLNEISSTLVTLVMGELLLN
ncbi:chemotaxis protein CheB [Nostoc sp.]|uniref:chemotaxis protein CheB n=1 Tax=Nostoc sp. TaxID=1180 RepID=UPI002FF48155